MRIDHLLGCRTESPLGRVLVHDVASPTYIAPGRFIGPVSIRPDVRVQRTAPDVVDRRLNVYELQAGCVRLHAEVPVDVNLRRPVNLVEATKLMAARAIEEEEITGCVRKARRVDRVDDLAVPLVLEQVPAGARHVDIRFQVVPRGPIEDA